MFIATRFLFIIYAKSEMLNISLFAEEVRRPCTFYKHYVPTARFCPDSLERLLLRQSSGPSGRHRRRCCHSRSVASVGSSVRESRAPGPVSHRRRQPCAPTPARGGQTIPLLPAGPGRIEVRAPRRPHRRRWHPSSPMPVPRPYRQLPVSRNRPYAPWSRCMAHR